MDAGSPLLVFYTSSSAKPCSFVPTYLSQEDLHVMLFLHDIYNIGRISIYVIKRPGEMSSSTVVETQEGCLLT